MPTKLVVKATDERSVSGGVVMFGSSVTWCSRTQKCVAISTTEAEYVAIACVMKEVEVLFLRQDWRFSLLGAGLPCSPPSIQGLPGSNENCGQPGYVSKFKGSW